MSRKKTIGKKRKAGAWWTPKRAGARRGTPAEAEKLAELARRIASAELLSLQARTALDMDPEWQKLKETHSIKELIEKVRPKRRKGRPTETKTLLWIERIAEQKRLGRGYLHLAPEFRPDLPIEKARIELKKFRNRKKIKKEIDSRAEELRRMEVPS